MEREDKELLLKDLCARLSYGVKALILNEVNIEKDVVLTLKNIPYIQMINLGYIKDCKPYLFPLSSMTEEQKEEYHYIVNYISPDDTENWAEGEFVYVNQIEQLLHFYHVNHLDYRGLIPKDLALDATGLNIY